MKIFISEKLKNKCRFCLIGLSLIIGMITVSFVVIAKDFLSPFLATTISIIVIAFYIYFLIQLYVLTSFRVKRNNLIIRQNSKKVDVMPIQQAKIEPMFVQSKTAIFRLKYVVDGIKQSALIWTNQKEFKKIKKGKP